MNEKIKTIVKKYVEDEAPLVCISTDMDGTIIELNGFTAELLGKEIIGDRLKDVFVDFNGSLDEKLERYFQEQRRNELLNLNTAKELPESFRFSFFSLENKNLVLGKPDVGELEHFRKEMVSLNNEMANISRELQKKNRELEIFESALEDSLNAVAITNPAGDITRVNSALLETWGYSEKEVRGEPFESLLVENSSMNGLKNALDTREDWRGELEAKKKDGRTFHVLASASFISGDEGLIFTFIDISERKYYEKREEFLNSLLRHDVGNKAQIVEGYLLLMEEYDLPDELERYVDQSKKAIKHSKDIIEKVRTLRDITQSDTTIDIHLKHLLKKIIDENDQTLEDNGITVNYDGREVVVKGGPLLEEMFSNLIENAIKHSRCDKIKISIEDDGSDEEVKIKIEDDGKGIPDDIKEKIFERGFKTGETSGSGLGMYLVKEIVESYGGHIEVKDSELGGTRFDIRLQKIK